MAIYGDNNKANNATQNFATDEKGMMEEAKAYAKKDFKTVLTTVGKLGHKVVKEIPDKANGTENFMLESTIAKALILTKYEFIKESRANRIEYFD